MMKMRVALLACASLLDVLMASAARPEPPIGSRVGERLSKDQVKDERDAAQAAHELAGCVIAKRGSTGRDLLDARNEDDVKKAKSRMGGEYECLANLPGNDLVEGVAVSYPPDVMRGDIAEELVKRSRSAVVALQPLPIQKVYSRSWFAFTGRNVSVDEMAACVADTDPSGIAGLLDTQPFSEAEGAAFATLVPFMGPCLRSGTKLEGKREPLRAALAEALYQRLTNPAESNTTMAHTAVQTAH